MRTILVILGLAVIALAALMALGFVSIDQTRQAALPSVKVEGGQTPKFEADVGRIGVGTENRTVTVPTLEVERPANAQVAQ